MNQGAARKLGNGRRGTRAEGLDGVASDERWVGQWHR